LTSPVLDKVQDKAGSGTTIYATYSNYTSRGQAQTITYGNGVVTTRTFADPAHSSCIPANSFKLCTLKTQKGANPLYQDFTYTFTADGNVDLITDPINGNQDFGYDALDRLTSASGPYGTGGAPDTITYSYNQIGNILTNSQLTGGTFTYPTSGAGVVRPHAVQVAGPYSYSYDNNGNQTGITSTLGDYSSSTTFNVDNRLASAVTTFGSTTINSTFVYDGEGGRVKKIVGTTTTRYISKLYECDTTGANTSCSRFIWAGDTRIATVAVTTGTTHYWHGDHLGSSSVITDSTGAKAQALTYSPYGGVRTNQSFTTPAIDVPYKYTGQEFDDSTDFYFYDSRYYDPWFGRFLSPDTLVPDPLNPQDLNRYSYVRNSPPNYTDPTGYCTEDDGSSGWFCSQGQSINMSYDPLSNTISVHTPVLVTPPTQPWGISGGNLSFSGFDSPGSAWDLVQHGLGIAEVVPSPFISTPAGLFNAGISIVRGHYGDAGWSALTAVPILGTIGKYGRVSEAVLEHLKSILKPGGKLIGERGSSPEIRVLSGGAKAAEQLILDLGKVGKLDRNIKNGFLIKVDELGTLTYRYGSVWWTDNKHQHPRNR
jgi:RHS repeat-associated protein